MKKMYKEVTLNDEIINKLIELSIRWEDESSSHGYIRNDRSDIEGNRVFVYEEDDEIIAYLFGYLEKSKRTSLIKEGTMCFEVMELYVIPERRKQGIGSKLFRFVEEMIKSEARYITLSSSTKNYKAILHFYIDELDMKFWNVRLYKEI